MLYSEKAEPFYDRFLTADPHTRPVPDWVESGDPVAWVRPSLIVVALGVAIALLVVIRSL